MITLALRALQAIGVLLGLGIPIAAALWLGFPQ